MLVINPLYLSLAIAQPILFTCATPTLTTPSSLTPRTQYCSNVPGQVAGSLPSKRHHPPSSPHLPHPRAPTYIYCAGGHTRTFVLITLGSQLPAPADTIATLITNAVAKATSILGGQAIDGPIPGGLFTLAYENVAIWIQNANNHQVTWGVLGTALVAIADYFEEKGAWGGAMFEVWDGDNQVGAGKIGYLGEGKREEGEG